MGADVYIVLWFCLVHQRETRLISLSYPWLEHSFFLHILQRVAKVVLPIKLFITPSKHYRCDSTISHTIGLVSCRDSSLFPFLRKVPSSKIPH